MAIEKKIKFLGAELELPARQHFSSETVPRILIFSIVLGAEYSFYLKSIATYAPTFYGYNNSVLARVDTLFSKDGP